LGGSKIAQQIVEGTFDILDKLDNTTALNLEEIGQIGVKLSNGEVSITICDKKNGNLNLLQVF